MTTPVEIPTIDPNAVRQMQQQTDTTTTTIGKAAYPSSHDNNNNDNTTKIISFSKKKKMKTHNNTTTRSNLILFLSIVVAAFVISILFRHLPLLSWSIAQWTISVDIISTPLQQFSWDSWSTTSNSKKDERGGGGGESCSANSIVIEEEIPIIHIQDFTNNNNKEDNDPLHYVESTYGKNWRDKPLLLKGLWNTTALKDPKRRLNLQGLLNEEAFEIPYFKDSRIYGSLSPDGIAPVGEIVQRIVDGYPHKIGSQLYIQEYPDLLEEVAPMELIQSLFGNHFSKHNLLGHGRTFGFFPGTTTVPLFVANGNSISFVNDEEKQHQQQPSERLNTTTSQNHPSTGLHCEPIGNVAVQLSGVKEWTLIEPEHYRQLKPAIAADGRAFFASWIGDLQADIPHVPRYVVRTYAGDAIWIPTWTWHRVDYIQSEDKDEEDISIGASLFHFRPVDFIRRNPLYAILLLPAILKEALGLSTQ